MVEGNNTGEYIEQSQEAEEVMNDQEIFKQDSAVLMNDVEYEFSVRNPHDAGGNIVYDCKGKDKQGVWEGKRRYNEFHLLHETLTNRFPGVPIPCIPPKKAFNNKDQVFIQDRTFYLQRFMRKIARLDFLIESQEFQTFARPNGIKIDTGLGKLLPLSSKQKYERSKLLTKTDDAQYSLAEKEAFKTRITEFGFYVKKINPQLMGVKSQIAQFLTSKQATIVSY